MKKKKEMKKGKRRGGGLKFVEEGLLVALPGANCFGMMVVAKELLVDLVGLFGEAPEVLCELALIGGCDTVVLDLGGF